jgi:HlyD family secretion protein
MAASKSKTRRKVVFAVLLVLALGGLGAWAKFRKKEVPLIVQTEKAMRRSLTELVVANGKIQPVVMVKISPEVSGEIIELAVKEGQTVKKGDLLLRIKPDFYRANRDSADASHKASLANRGLAEANCKKAEIEFKRSRQLFDDKLISESQFVESRTAWEVAQAQVKANEHQSEVAAAALARAEEELRKTTISSPLDGTITKLNSQAGERVVGTATMAGTDVMTIADLGEMEARVDLGEVDVVLICAGQTARLEVDAYRDKKFTGEVTEIANTAKSSGIGTQQEATKFEVRIRVKEKELFRPGMSVTAEVETRYRTNVLAVPIQSVTTRLPKDANEGRDGRKADADAGGENIAKKDKPKKETANKPVEVVFVVDGAKSKMVKVARGISDENYSEIRDGLEEGAEIVSGSYKAINRELEDGKLIKVDNEKRKPAEKK